LWLCVKSVVWCWWNAIGGVTTLLAAAALSLLWPTLPPAHIERPATPEPFPWRQSAVLLVFFVCMLAFCLLLPRMFEHALQNEIGSRVLLAAGGAAARAAHRSGRSTC